MSTQKWPLQIIVGAKDAASTTLRKINGTLSGVGAGWAKLNGAMRMSGVGRALGSVRDLTMGVGRTFLEAGRKAALFGTLAGAALGAVINRVTGAGDKTIKLARHLNVSAEKLQAWRLAAKDAGVDAGAFEAAMTKLGTSIGEASLGRGRAQDFIAALRVLGVEFEDAEGKAKTMTTIFPEIADALQRLPDEQKRAAFSKALFGEGNFMILDALKDGAAGLEAAEASARAAGAILSEEQLVGFEAFQQTLHEIGVEFTGITSQLTTTLLPTIQQAATAFRTWLVDNQERITWWAGYIQTNLPLAIGVLSDAAKEFWAWFDDKLDATATFIANVTMKVLELKSALQDLTPTKAAVGVGRGVQDIINDVPVLGPIQRFLDPSAEERYERQQAAASGEVKVSFANMPRGARVTRDEAARRSISLDVGYAMREVGLA